jgi:glycosyltransferase involved in cell wall biosynthesis
LKILIVTDAWPPVVSGVVRTYMTTIDRLQKLGHEVVVIEPSDFWTVPFPGDTHLRLAIGQTGKVARKILAARPDAIHVASEGPLGLSARKWCVRKRVPFTTSYTTKLPEHANARFGVPTSWVWPFVRRFHRPSAGVMVSTDRLKRELAEQGITNTVRWSRGVDTELFRPRSKDFLSFPRPIYLSVGRVAAEKNLDAFLSLDLDGTKVVVGDGPALGMLKRKYPAAQFLGEAHGEELAKFYAAADVTVFSSTTDTFGLVLLESLACGVPVAALPVAGPLDVIGDSGAGVLDTDLGRAARQALQIDPEICRAHAQEFSWEKVAAQFVGNLHPIDWTTTRA